MMTKRNVPLALAALAAGLAAGCTPTHTASTGAPPAGEEIRLSHGACFGFCPVYTVAVTPSGNVTFNGERHTAELGERARTVGPAKYEALRTALADLRPASGTQETFDCPVAMPTDTSALTIEWIGAGGERTSLTYRTGCRAPEGQKIQDAFDAQIEALGVAGWAAQTTRPGASRG